jgi:hypothetical protein
MQQAFVDYFKCPASAANFQAEGVFTEKEPGFFRFGPSLICFGRLSSGRTNGSSARKLDDALSGARITDEACHLPFDPDEVVANLRQERYLADWQAGGGRWPTRSIKQKAYYAMRPLLPVPVRKHVQRIALRGWDRIAFPRWPVDQTIDRLFDKLMALTIRVRRGERVPFIWFWPDGCSSAAIMTHDVETEEGRDFCSTLMDLNDSFEVKSSFQFIPEERYAIPEELLAQVRSRGFEVNVHDLNHDGNLFKSRDEFLRRADRINEYGRRFGARGYRSGVLYRNLAWYGALEFAYDMSVPNLGHLDPQPGGCCTTKPYFIGEVLELPVMATQDYSLFHILRQYSIELWEQQIQMTLEQNGLMSFIVHPDYVIDRRARETYSALLRRLAELRQRANVWLALPGQVNDWWRSRSQMKLVCRDGDWVIEGRDRQRARIAYASLEGDSLVYSLKSNTEPLRLVQVGDSTTRPLFFDS